ncbi:RND family efflux transporter MFP subunit [gut metagenome]|uniref:RND family efflux transporter MFP subunit n=1 Tax=gut metagenome TaxID=749906 RepID=J9G828_9ZZZZ
MMDRMIENKQRIWRKYGAYGGVGLVVLILFVGTFVGWNGTSVRVSASQLTVQTVTEGEFNDYIAFQGQVVPIQVVQISPEEGGIVVEKGVEEGAQVHPGEVIVRLSNSNLDLQILNAEAELAEKQNLLRNTQVAMQQDRLNNETELATLAMDVQRKQRAYRQKERLHREQLISREEYLQSREDYELAQRKHDLVQQRLAQDSTYRTLQMEQMEDNLQNMQRNVQLVRSRKDKLAICSPIEGQLGLLDVELGQSIGAGQKIGQLNDLTDFKIEASLSEHYIDRVRTGLQATLTRDGKRYALRVRKVLPEVREGLFRTELVFEGERPEQIRIGQTYHLSLQLGQPQPAILLPRGTFFQSTGGQWVFVLAQDGKAAYRRSIRIGRQNPKFYEVLEGLAPGEQVITSGYEAFREQEELKVVD